MVFQGHFFLSEKVFTSHSTRFNSMRSIQDIPERGLGRRDLSLGILLDVLRRGICILILL